MAAKKIIKKKTTTKKSPVKTVSVGRPIPKPPITVLGIDFEQGDNLTFGKCRRKADYAAGRIFNYLSVGGGRYILWNWANDGFLDYFSAQDPGFTAGFDILDFDTEAPELLPGGGNDNQVNLVRGAGGMAYDDPI